MWLVCCSRSRASVREINANSCKLTHLQLQCHGDASSVKSAIAILPSLDLPPPPPRPHFRQDEQQAHAVKRDSTALAAAAPPQPMAQTTALAPCIPPSRAKSSPRAGKSIALQPLLAGEFGDNLGGDDCTSHITRTCFSHRTQALAQHSTQETLRARSRSSPRRVALSRCCSSLALWQ